MSKRVLVIGAAGQVGSCAVRASLKRGYPTIAFLRTPSKLLPDLKENAELKVIAGSAADAAAIASAIRNNGSPVSCVILCAPFGSMRDTSQDWEKIAGVVTDEVRRYQNEKGGKKVKLWIMAGSALLDHPEYPGRHLNTFMPMTFYPAYGRFYEVLKKEYEDIDWTINCPALIGKGEPRGKIVATEEVLPGYQPPFSLTRWIPFGIGIAGNVMYNWMTGPITFTSLGEYMVEHSNADGKLKGKRVGLLDDANASS